jgi:hypothetical protein
MEDHPKEALTYLLARDSNFLIYSHHEILDALVNANSGFGLRSRHRAR